MTAFIEMHCKNDTELVPNGLSIIAQLAHALPAGASDKKDVPQTCGTSFEKGFGKNRISRRRR